MPHDDDAGVAAAADDFGKRWQTWMAYRRCVIEVSPPGGAPVRFRHRARAGRGDGGAADFPGDDVRGDHRVESRRRAAAERALNRRANDRLAAHLDARMVQRWPATNAPGSRWREASFAVLGLELDEAWRLGEAFQQQAIDYIDRGVPLLVARRRGRVVMWKGELCAA